MKPSSLEKEMRELQKLERSMEKKYSKLKKGAFKKTTTTNNNNKKKFPQFPSQRSSKRFSQPKINIKTTSTNTRKRSMTMGGNNINKSVNNKDFDDNNYNLKKKKQKNKNNKKKKERDGNVGKSESPKTPKMKKRSSPRNEKGKKGKSGTVVHSPQRSQSVANNINVDVEKRKLKKRSKSQERVFSLSRENLSYVEGDRALIEFDGGEIEESETIRKKEEELGKEFEKEFQQNLENAPIKALESLKVPINKTKKPKKVQQYYKDLDQLEEEDMSKGTARLKETFSPLLKLFDVEPSGNVFRDFGLLADKLEDENYFLQKIFEKIFEMYDTQKKGSINAEELKICLMDVGEAIGEKSLMEITENHLQMILYSIDANGNGIIEKEELITYLLQWVNETERDDEEENWYIPPYEKRERRFSVDDSYAVKMTRIRRDD